MVPPYFLHELDRCRTDVSMMRQALASLLFVAFCVAVPGPAWARVIYVNNRIGNDINDGLAATNQGLRVGPVKTFSRAAHLLGKSDTLEIANNGEDFPYRDSLRLVGGGASGIETLPLIVNGNGAVIDGADPLQPDDWEHVEGSLWRVVPWRKGWVRLFRDGDELTEIKTERDAALNLEPGQWTFWQGAIYYLARPDELPANEPYSIARREAGVFLYGVRYVVVRDLTVKRHRLDGVNAHDQARPVILENVRSSRNARAGIFVGGSSQLIIRGAEVQGNREASIIATEQARVDITDSRLDTEPRTID